MTNSLFTLLFGLLTVFVQFYQSNFDLVQDQDGIIHFCFIDELGAVKSLPLYKTESILKDHFYDTESKMLGLVTLSNQLSLSGFTGISYNHISFKFLKINQSENSLEYLYQTGFQFDNKVSIENYTFHSIDKFQIEGTGQEGFLSFDLEQGSVSYSKSGKISVKEMAKLNTSNNLSGQNSSNSSKPFVLSRANQPEVLFN